MRRSIPFVLAGAVAILFLGFLLASTEGHAVPQVVDLYLVCQYAKALAEGHPFQYNLGEAPSTGATSLLHTAVLGAAHALGARGEGLVAFAIGLGIAFYLGSVALARRIATRLAGEREGLLAASLLALGGPVVWAFLYGSDAAPFMFLSLLTLDSLLGAWRGEGLGRLAVAGALLALTRPEGLPVALVIGVGVSLGPGRGQRAARQALAWVPAAAGLVTPVLNRVLTGQWLGSSLADKSLFANYGLIEGLAVTADYLTDVVRGLLLGFYPSQVPVGFSRGWAALYFPPLGLIAVLLALARPPEAARVPLRLWGATVGGLLLLLAPNMFMGVHFNRHLVWALPSLLVLAAVGLGWLARQAGRADPAVERGVFTAVAGLWLALGALSTLRFGTLYGEGAGEVYRRDVRAAEWIARNLPRGTPIANLATSVEYLTGHRSLNLHGVTSPAFFGNRTAEREAGTFEALGRLSPVERPALLLTSVAAQEANASMRELVDPEPLYRSSSFADELLIYRMRWDLPGRNRQMFLPSAVKAVEGLREVDRLNVGDSRDEAAHDYGFRSRLGDLNLAGTVRVDSYPGPPAERVMDAGRAILGHESFTLRAARGRDLVLVMRTAASVNANVYRASGNGSYGLELAEAGLTIEAEGQSAGRFAFRPRPGWDEQVLRIPGSLLGEGRTRLRLSGRYASFFYWAFQ
jgi:hypothetical protein